jgi:hypothetical protein
MKAKKIYKPNTKKIRSVLSHPQIYTVLEERNRQELKKIINWLLENLGEKNPKLQNENLVRVTGSVDLLKKLVIERPITPILSDLCEEFIVLVAAWNESVAKNLQLRESIYDLRRLLDCHYSFADLINISKILIQKIEQFRQFSPPAFEISRHYLESIKKLESAEGKKIKKNDKNCKEISESFYGKTC